MMSKLPVSGTSRRFWLGQSLGLLGATAFPRWVLGNTQDKKPSWIDAHVHVWPSVTKEYPLAEGFAPSVVEPASFTPKELFQQCRPCGVARIVLIQMNFFGFDNRYMLDTIAGNPGVFSGVAVIDHERPDARAEMTRLLGQGVRGYRLYATAENVKSWKTSKSIAAMFRNGADLGQAMCMLSDPESLEGIASLCQRNPQTTVVIDHFSRIGMRHAPTQQELETLCNLARFPKVYVKTSAFYALGQKKPPYTDLIPMIRRLLKAFGPERLMWASDCPYQVQSPHTYEASLALVRDHLDGISDEDRNHILFKTAEQVFFS